MQKNRLFYLILTVLVFMFTVSGLASASPKRIGVVGFSNASQVSDGAFGSGMSDILVHELVQDKNFEVITRSNSTLRALENEYRDGMSGLIDPRKAAQVGKQLGLRYVVTGKIIEAGLYETNILGFKQWKAKVLINVQMVDVETAQIVLSEIAEESKSAAMIGDPKDPAFNSKLPATAFSVAGREAIAKIAMKIHEYSPLEGVVVLVRPDSIMIDIGRDNGVKVGQKYEIIREGSPVYHPTSGALIGVDRIMVADFTITGVEAGTANGGKIKRTDKEEIKVGDIVRMVKRK